MDSLTGFGEIGLGSRLKRLSDNMMREIQLVYDYFNIDFDPYLFPIIKVISHHDGITNTLIKEKLNLTQPAITQAINKLDKKLLIDIQPDKLDKRKKIISLSTYGKEVVTKMKPLWSVMDNIVKQHTNFKSNSLIDHLNKFENIMNTESLSTSIINEARLKMKDSIEIISFDKKYSKDFYNLNIEWLKTFFVVEPYDEEVLGKPNKYIISKGGHIFFAKLNNQVVGTVALMPTKNAGIYELTKMAVSPEHRGLKIGQKLMKHCIAFAKNDNLDGLILYSSTLLENAIYIYRKYGFIEIPVEPDSPYVRSDIKMELNF